MAKSGRPKKPGARYRNGRLTRQARAEDAREAAIQTRMRQYGISKEAATIAEPTGEQLYGFPLGRLYSRGDISREQYLAGNTFAEVVRSYLLTKGIGAPTAPAFDMDRRGASLTEKPVKNEDVAQEFMAALAEVDRVNFSIRSATSLLWDICLREGSENMSRQNLGVFREGLNAIDRVLYRRSRLRRAA